MSFESLFTDSRFHMTDVGAKAASFRRAVATGRIQVGAAALDLIRRNALPKGDVLKLAEIAGIQGAKNTASMIPLCHPLPLDHVALYLELEPEPESAMASVAAYCTVSTFSKTGVEMEALAGVNAALLTVYDLVKPVEPALVISDVRLLLKEGGKKGLWLHPQGMPDFLREPAHAEDSAKPLHGINAAVLTLSDRASSGVYEDASGALLKALLKDLGAEVTHYRLLPDEREPLSAEIKNLAAAGKVRLLICTGGTGLAPRDITPDVVEPLLERTVAGIGELLRSSGAHRQPLAWLSRSIAGTIGDMLVITLPGSRSAVRDGMQVLQNLLPHALNLLAGKNSAHSRPHATRETP